MRKLYKLLQIENFTGPQCPVSNKGINILNVDRKGISLKYCKNVKIAESSNIYSNVKLTDNFPLILFC